MIYLNLGRREMGKTTLALYLVSRLNCPSVVFDPRGLFVVGDRTKLATNDAAVDIGFEQLYAREIDRLVVTPDGDTTQLFDYTMAHCKDWTRDNRPLGIIVDELRFIDLKECGPSFDWLLRCGDRGQTVIVLTAHRPKDVPPDIQAISDVWCLFQCTQVHDLKVIAERCDPAVAELVSKLGPREFIAWDDTRGKYSLHARPGEWFVGLKHTGASGARVASPLSGLQDDAPAKVDKPGLFS